MKKLICILLALMMVLSLAACAEENSPVPTDSAAPETLAPTEEPLAPDTEPAPTASEAPEAPAATLEGLVYTSCDKTYVWRDSDGNTNTVQVTLPALYPLGEFAEKYNADMELSSEYIFSGIEYDMENENPAHLLSVSYDAWCNDSLLTILLTRENTYGKPTYEVATFDLDAQKKLTAADLSERLLGMSYPSFLLAGSEFMTQEYHDTYYQPDMTDDEWDAFDSSGSSIGHEPWLLFYRELFLNEAGEIMFLYPRIRPTEDWYAGVDSDDAIVTVDPDQFLSPLGEEEAMQWLLTLHASGMGADEEVFSYILQTAFFGDPEGFAAGLAAMDEEQRDYPASLLFYALWDEDRPAFRDLCIDCLAQDSLAEDVKEILYQLLEHVL